MNTTTQPEPANHAKYESAPFHRSPLRSSTCELVLLRHLYPQRRETERRAAQYSMRGLFDFVPKVVCWAVSDGDHTMGSLYAALQEENFMCICRPVERDFWAHRSDAADRGVGSISVASLLDGELDAYPGRDPRRRVTIRELLIAELGVDVWGLEDDLDDRFVYLAAKRSHETGTNLLTRPILDAAADVLVTRTAPAQEGRSK